MNLNSAQLLRWKSTMNFNSAQLLRWKSTMNFNSAQLLRWKSTMNFNSAQLLSSFVLDIQIDSCNDFVLEINHLAILDIKK